MSTTGRPSNWNLPNAITIARIALAPLVFWLTLSASTVADAWWATALFVVVLASDSLDGYLARSRGLVTDLGKLLDPIADKLVTNGVLICLSVLNQLPWWVTGVVVVRELGITVWRLVEMGRGTVVPANSGGKLKTVAQSVAIGFALAPLPTLLGPGMNAVNTVLMSVAFVLTVWSGLMYIRDALRLRRANA